MISLLVYGIIMLLTWLYFSVMLIISISFFSVDYIGMEFLWYDFWIGIYYDRNKKIIYINPLPCVVVSYQRV